MELRDMQYNGPDELMSVALLTLVLFSGENLVPVGTKDTLAEMGIRLLEEATVYRRGEGTGNHSLLALCHIEAEDDDGATGESMWRALIVERADQDYVFHQCAVSAALGGFWAESEKELLDMLGLNKVGIQA